MHSQGETTQFREPHQILSKEDYGYAALIPPRRNHVESSEEAGRIYEELGGYLGLFYVLGGSDMHFRESSRCRWSRFHM